MKVCEGLARCLQPHALNGMAGLNDAVDLKRRDVTRRIENCENLEDNQNTLGDVQGDEQKNNVKRQKFGKSDVPARGVV